ncbi:hypothetical protein MARSALSMR5_02560 [Marinobacter salarius]|uniref:Uncharacterized protein n=1 Tax=Marinobacter salarius TaxID=1420917 RepID=A0A1W6KB52_9GAMM|nr:hypothetical protein MARSALSMR5_02560 [Marinobacter salarius]
MNRPLSLKNSPFFLEASLSRFFYVAIYHPYFLNDFYLQ